MSRKDSHAFAASLAASLAATLMVSIVVFQAGDGSYLTPVPDKLTSHW